MSVALDPLLSSLPTLSSHPTPDEGVGVVGRTPGSKTVSDLGD